MAMNVLITGHLGYIGPALVRLLKEAGWGVVGLDTGYFAECVTGGSALVTPDREIRKDIRCVTAADFAGVDAVVHLADLSNDPMGELSPALTVAINREGGRRCAEAAKAAGVRRFVFASSCSIYGASGAALRPLDESAPVRPVSAYAESKVATEQDLAELADGSFSPVCLRNATAFGVSPRLRFDLVLNNLMAWARTTGTIRVLSDGTPWRPLVHVEDICRAVHCALTAPREAIHGQAFNIGRPDANYRVRTIAETIARHVAGARVEIVGVTSGDLRSYQVDFTKALTRLPGFAPVWTLDAGCRELAEWFDRQAISADEFQTRTYVRLLQLHYLRERNVLDDALFWR